MPISKARLQEAKTHWPIIAAGVILGFSIVYIFLVLLLVPNQASTGSQLYIVKQNKLVQVDAYPTMPPPTIISSPTPDRRYPITLRKYMSEEEEDWATYRVELGRFSVSYPTSWAFTDFYPNDHQDEEECLDGSKGDIADSVSFSDPVRDWDGGFSVKIKGKQVCQGHVSDELDFIDKYVPIDTYTTKQGDLFKLFLYSQSPGVTAVGAYTDAFSTLPEAKILISMTLRPTGDLTLRPASGSIGCENAVGDALDYNYCYQSCDYSVTEPLLGYYCTEESYEVVDTALTNIELFKKILSTIEVKE